MKDGDVEKIPVTNLDHAVTERLHSIPTEEHKSVLTLLDNTHMVITHVKSHSDASLGIGLWDTKFNTMKTHKKYPPGERGSVHSLFRMSNTLLVRFDTAVYSLPFSVSPTSLCSVLGSITPVVQEDESDLPVRNVINTLLDKSQTKDYNSFQVTFGTLFKRLNESQEEAVLIKPQITELIQRIVKEKSFFAKEELLQLVSFGVVPANLCLEVVGKFVQEKEPAAVHSCLLNIKDIPESVLVQCLGYFLSMDGIDSTQQGSGSSETLHNPFPDEISAFVNRALMVPFNDVYLLDHLRALDFDKCMLLVDYLR